VYTWGDNTEGRLGLGEEINEAIEFPMRVSKIKEKSVRRVISGSNFVFAMGEDWIH
jgi:alpha-tubulin suppressor-like RCC1 family protein